MEVFTLFPSCIFFLHYTLSLLLLQLWWHKCLIIQYCPPDLLGSVHIFQSFSLWCSDWIISSDLYSSSQLFLCHLHSVTKSIQWGFCFGYSIWSKVSMWFFFMASISLLRFSIFPFILTVSSLLYNSCFKFFVKSSQYLCHIGISICWLSFPMAVEIFLDFCMPGNFGLCPSCCEYYVISFWVLFKSYEKCWYIVFRGNRLSWVPAASSK